MAVKDLDHVNANLLIALDHLITEASVTRAAERQNVTPSAMSHSLRTLRVQLDDPILIRTQRGMRRSPYAERIASPLRRALKELRHALVGDEVFDAARSDRHFVVIAADFLSTFLMAPIAKLLAVEAPLVEIENRPIARRSRSLTLEDTWTLAEGEVDLALGAELGGVPGLMHDVLYDERFVCMVRENHPTIDDTLSLEQYADTPHLVTTITDERTPTWIDRALASEGLRRTIRMRTRFFMATPLILAESDMVLTCPFQLARYFSARLPVRMLPSPIELPAYAEYQVWHERYDRDPANLWLRDLFRRAATIATAG